MILGAVKVAVRVEKVVVRVVAVARPMFQPQCIHRPDQMFLHQDDHQ